MLPAGLHRSQSWAAANSSRPRWPNSRSRPIAPLLVDANHGYGNALNVKYTVEELGTAGVAPASIKVIASPELTELVTRQADYSKWSKDFLNAALSGG
jgi:hypothetical protein